MATNSFNFSGAEIAAYYAALVPDLKRPATGWWRGPCPIHKGTRNSFAVNPKTGEWFCHSECDCGGSIIQLEMAINEVDYRTARRSVLGVIGREWRTVAKYIYVDEAGEPLFSVVKRELGAGTEREKYFYQQRYESGRWLNGLGDVRRVPYHLNQVAKWKRVFIVEGEKDCDIIWNEFNLIATTNPMGAGNWSPEYNRYFSEKHVTIIPDNDDAGRTHVLKLSEALLPVAASVRVLELPNLPEKGDTADWVKAGGTREQLAQLRNAAQALDNSAFAELSKRWGLTVHSGRRHPADEPAAHAVPPMTPEAVTMATAQLLSAIKSWIQKYVVITEDQAVILAAWLLHTYVLDASDITPYIHITAAEKESGKSLLMEVLVAVAFNPVRSGGMTAAALVRTVDSRHPTLFLDEMDAAINGDKEFAEAQRGILNEGFRRGGTFTKCDRNSHDVREFDVFSSKCFAGIGKLQDTVTSRSIVIEMRRKLRIENVAPFRQRLVTIAAAPLKASLEEWASQGAIALLKEIQPAPIDSLGDRQNDICEPLLAIALIAGEGWRRRLTDALVATFKAPSAEDTSIGVTLLQDIRAVFDQGTARQISSQAVANHLCKVEGSPWADWAHGKGLSTNQLARQLKKYHICPQTIRVGEDTAKGYRRKDFEDAWERYCPLTPIQNVTTSQPASLLDEP